MHQKLKYHWSKDMSDQLQELLQRVYDEGVNKAKSEAETILDKAKTEAAEILSKATAEAETLLTQAKKKSDDLHKNTDSDLKMAAQHTISSVKQKLTDIFLDKVFDAKLHTAATDPAFVKQLILEIVGSWKETSGHITISAALQGKLDEAFLSSLKDVAGNGLTVDFVPQMKSGFAIAPADGSYKLSFTDEDFANLFKSYLRPRSNQILFQN